MAIVSGIALASCAVTAEEDEADLLDDPDGTAAVERPSSSRFQAIAPCEREADYLVPGVISFGWGKQPFTPACVRLASGGTVIFEGPAAEHPIEPRPLGSPFSPIATLSTRGGSEVEFPDQGFYPFRCARHPEEIGVIWSSYAY